MAFFFFIAACVYSMAGLGGGPAYVALMAVGGIPLYEIPPISFLCNLIVVTGGAVHFIRHGHFHWHWFWPFIVSAVPMSFLGACLPVPRELFMIPMGICLLYIAVKLIFFDSPIADDANAKAPSKIGGLAIGSSIGLICGILGIGGGVFLSPLLMYLHWGTVKQIAAGTSVFILTTSLAGLSGCLATHMEISTLATYWPYFLAVLLGGQFGSYLGAGRLSGRWIKAVTVVLVVTAGVQLLTQAILHTPPAELPLADEGDGE